MQELSPLLIFACSATSRIRDNKCGVRQAGGADGWWWIMLLGSAILAHAVGTVVLMVYQAVAVVATVGNESSAKALSDLAGMGFGYFFVTLVAYALVSGMAFLRTAVMPRSMQITAP